MLKKLRKSSRNQKGFTIMELMIATAVFSIVLLVCLSAIVYVGRLYYKGLATSQTQAAARDAVDSVSDAVKFSRDSVSLRDVSQGTGQDDWDGWVCIGTRKYSYRVNRVLVDGTPTDGQTDRALIESVDPDCGNGSVAYEPRTDNVDRHPHRELLGEFMRLNDFHVIPDGSTGLVTINVSVAFGGNGSDSDDELFVRIDSRRTDVENNTLPHTTELIQSCATGVPGGEFCAVSHLSKSVVGVK